MEELRLQLADSLARIQLLEAKVFCLENRKYEKYYQTFLEGYLGKSHKVTKYGITDISTDTHIIEIKPWKHFKTCLGQLKCYNYDENKHLVAAFFGDFGHTSKDKVIPLLHSHGVEVWDLQDTPNGINVVKHTIDTQTNDNFYSWLEQNIIKQENGILNLKDVCNLYMGRACTKNEKSGLKRMIEKWIKEVHDEPPICKYSRFNGTKYNGWKGFLLNYNIVNNVQMS